MQAQLRGVLTGFSLVKSKRKKNKGRATDGRVGLPRQIQAPVKCAEC